MTTTASHEQGEEEMVVELTEQTVTKTIICKLETSHRKNDRVRAAVDEWQQIAGRMASLMPSIDTDHWRTQDTTLYHVAHNEFPDATLRAHDVGQAAYKVGESFGSWESNGREGERPRFGDGDYLRLCHCGIEIAPNQRGYGLKAKLKPYNPEWFHVVTGPYQEHYLGGIVADELGQGSAELHLHDDGSLFAHLSVSEDVDVYAADDLDRWVGVCLGESVLYSAVLADADDEIDAVEMESGKEFRHYRERFKTKRARLMERGDLRELVNLRDEHRRYTDYVTHRAAREVVNFAATHGFCGLRLENLTHLRERSPDPIHDFPYAEVADKIRYKATEAGLPVEEVPPAYSKVTCRRCGTTDEESRDGAAFECSECGYEVHSFVNGAANIATEAHREADEEDDT